MSDLEEQVKNLGSKLGVPSEALENALTGNRSNGFTKGDPMTMDEVGDLEVGDHVWISNQRRGIDTDSELLEIGKDGSLVFQECDFKPFDRLDGSDHAMDTLGQMYLYHSV